jgi:O-methyltransferase involved in polyketide biosynthesis
MSTAVANRGKILLSKLTGAPETLLIMLSAKANESRRPDAILRDPKVLEIFDRIGDDLSRLKAGWMTQVGVCVRTVIIDDWAKEFLAKHPDATVINLGSGLDTRLSRIDNGRLKWYDVDFPEPLALRKEFFQETDRAKMIAGSAIDPATLAQIPQAEHVLVIAEGLCMFLMEDEMRRLVTLLADRFPNCTFIYDAITPFMVSRAGRFESFRQTSGQWRWGVWTGRELTAWDPRIEFVREESLFDRRPERWRWVRWLVKIPRIRKRLRQHVTELRLHGKKSE